MTAEGGTLVLTGADVARSLTRAECREAVERAFDRLGRGRVPPARSLGFDAPRGSFHVKAALFDAGRPRFVAKLNGNFPGNPIDRGLPTIQGVLILSDAGDGRALAVMDSAAVTAIRTAAASAVAADHLARSDASVLAIVGCGRQGAEHAEALMEVRRIREIRLVDSDPEVAEKLAARLATPTGPTLRIVTSVRDATRGADLVATCTSGSAFLLDPDDVSPGAFVAAVGADHPRKREIHPALMARARVVVDDLEQCAAAGDLHHAIEAGAMKATDVHADLGAVIAGQRPGRQSADDIVVFDSTGIALEDAAAADRIYERARSLGLGLRLQLDA